MKKQHHALLFLGGIINFCGAGALSGWLLMTSIDLPIRGLVLLWSIVVVVTLVVWGN